MTVAKRVVEQAIGEKLDGSPLDNPDQGKNPHAVALELAVGGPILAQREQRRVAIGRGELDVHGDRPIRMRGRRGEF